MPEEVEYATAASLAGLASEVESLRRGVEALQRLPRRIEEVAGLVTRLAEQTAAMAGGKREGTVTWLDLPEQAPADAELLLARLSAWVGGVYLRYADGARQLPACWLWHPEVVEELCWLHQAWLGAYAVEDAPISLAADWHDRLRPGVVRRIKDYAGMCSIEAHLPEGDYHQAAPAALMVDAVGSIAAWWAARSRQQPPVPSADQVARAGNTRSAGRGSRR